MTGINPVGKYSTVIKVTKMASLQASNSTSHMYLINGTSNIVSEFLIGH